MTHEEELEIAGWIRFAAGFIIGLSVGLFARATSGK